ncbi:MAG TPA: circadian clock KaiB family protein [Coleofasciculaceae cyanobacterium]
MNNESINDSVNEATEAFEQALAERDDRYYCLRLYIAGTTVQSIRALENIKKICEERLQGRYELEVIDIYQQPGLSQQESIIAVPTLIKRLPLPLQRIIGDMSKTDKVLVGLDLIPKTTMK